MFFVRPFHLKHLLYIRPLWRIDSNVSPDNATRKGSAYRSPCISRFAHGTIVADRSANRLRYIRTINQAESRPYWSVLAIAYARNFPRLYTSTMENTSHSQKLLRIIFTSPSPFLRMIEEARDLKKIAKFRRNDRINDRITDRFCRDRSGCPRTEDTTGGVVTDRSPAPGAGRAVEGRRVETATRSRLQLVVVLRAKRRRRESV